MGLGRLGAVAGGGLHVGGVRGHVEPDPGLQEVDHHQPDDQRERRHDFEIEERAQADAADVLHLPHVGDADRDGREDDRRDQHPHELDEAVAQRAHRGAALRPQDADRDAEGDRREHLEVEAPVQRLAPHRLARQRGVVEGGTIPFSRM